MLRVRDALDSKLRDQGVLLTALHADLSDLEKNLSLAVEAEKQSSSLENHLADALERLGWRVFPQISELVPSLVDLAGFVKQAAGLGWISSPITINALKAQVSQSRKNVASVELDLQKLEETQAKLRAAQEDAARADAKWLASASKNNFGGRRPRNLSAA